MLIFIMGELDSFKAKAPPLLILFNEFCFQCTNVRSCLFRFFLNYLSACAVLTVFLYVLWK